MIEWFAETKDSDMQTLLKISFLLFSCIILSNCSSGKFKNIIGCKSDDVLQVYCGFQNPEDIVVLPDNKHLLVSEFGAITPISPKTIFGNLSLLDTETGEKKSLNITLGESEWGDSDCKRESLEFSPHGIDFTTRIDGRYQLGIVNHLPEETIEMFELIKRDSLWELQWKGCAQAPEKAYFNDLALKRDGSFYASHMYDIDLSYWTLLFISFTKPETGFVYEWNQLNGFSKLANTEGSFPNGIELSLDEKNLFINYVFDYKTSKFNLETLEVETHHLSTGSPDNSHIVEDFIWVATQDFSGLDLMFCDETVIQCPLPFTIFKLRQSDLSEVMKISFKDTVMGVATVAVPLRNKLWMGSFHGDRVVSYDIDLEEEG